MNIFEDVLVKCLKENILAKRNTTTELVQDVSFESRRYVELMFIQPTCHKWLFLGKRFTKNVNCVTCRRSVELIGNILKTSNVSSHLQ